MTADSVFTHILIQRGTISRRSVIEHCIGSGAAARSNGPTDWWDIHVDSGRKKGLATESAITELEKSDMGWVRMWIGNLTFQLRFQESTNPDHNHELDSLIVDSTSLYLGKDAEDAAQNVNDYVSIISSLFQHLEAVYAYGRRHRSIQFGPEVDAAAIRSGSVPVFWLNAYSNEMVEKIGRSDLLSSPAEIVQELENGGIFLLVGQYSKSLENIHGVADNLELHRDWRL